MMMTTGEHLQELIANICENLDPKTWEKRRAINRLLIELQHLPGLLKSSHFDYLEALDKTWEWVSRSICSFQPRPSLSIQQSLTTWINGHLAWRIRDLYRRVDPAQYELDSPIDKDDESKTTWQDRLSVASSEIPVLSGLDAYIAQLHKREIQQICLELERYIEEDPQGVLRNCHLRKNPECNCQFLSKRLLFKEPPDRLADLSREFGINYQTLKSHWEKKCKPLLQNIVERLGYSRNEES